MQTLLLPFFLLIKFLLDHLLTVYPSLSPWAVRHEL